MKQQSRNYYNEEAIDRSLKSNIVGPHGDDTNETYGVYSIDKASKEVVHPVYSGQQ